VLEAQGARKSPRAQLEQGDRQIVIAMDNRPDTLEWIRKGVIAVTISQKPYSMTYSGYVSSTICITTNSLR